MKSTLFVPTFLGLLLSGCGVLKPVEDATVYHVLTPLVASGSLSHQQPAVAIKRPSIPGYLDRQQVVTRAKGQLMISPYDVWAEPLKSSISRVTASNLSRLTGSLNIRPVENFTTLEYTTVLEMNIARFEPDDADQLILEGTWKLQPVSSRETATRFFHIEVPIAPAGDPMAQRVAAMNQALETLARQIRRGL